MGDASSAPGNAPDRGHQEIGALKFLGLELPLPGWARTPLSVVAVIAVPIFLFITLDHMRGDAVATKELSHADDQLRQVQDDLKKAQDSLRSARDDYDEYVRHNNEAGTEFHHEPNLTVKYYRSDGCIYVLRAASSVWLKDPGRAAAPAPSPGRLEPSQHSALGPPEGEFLAASIIPAFYTVPLDQSPGAVHQSPRLRGACLNPHPGKYQSSDGQKRGCWLQVWRRWPDGCQHYQWFNTCASYWDTNSRGQPIVYWTSCAH